MKIGYHKREFLAKLIKTIIFFIIGILFLIPLFWMISSSLKTPAEIMNPGLDLIPDNPRWDNYKEVWLGNSDSKVVTMTTGYKNSIQIILWSIPISLVFSSLAAYAFAKIKFKGSGFVFMLFLSTMMIPGEVTLIPKFYIYNKIGLYNNLFAVILPHWFAPSAIFLLRQFYMGLPNDLMEAAKIDGAGHPRIFMQILLPLTKSALVSQTVLTFVSVWNEYLQPLIFLVKPKLTTVALAVQNTLQVDANRPDLAMAASTSAIVPTLIIFACCQSVFIEGIATSGVKG